MIKGNGASPGIGIGKVLLIEHTQINVEKNIVQDTAHEETKFLAAVEKAKEQLTEIKEKALRELGEDKAEIFNAHIMVLEDPEFIDSTINKIKDEKVNSEYAFKQIADMFISMFESMDNEYMKERAADIKDVSDRVLRNLLGIDIVDLSNLKEEVILVTQDLTPSDTATMDKNKVLGFLTNIGGKTSHTAIMARTLEIPAVVGLKDITDKVKTGDFIVFNGETGDVVLNPDENTINEYKKLKEEFDKTRKELESYKGKESKTIDGRQVELAGNIGTPNDIEGLIKNDAEGVGLYRTEFLYMDRDDFPSEDEQFEAYKAVLEAMNPKPIVIRTLDIGGDKELSYMKMDKEMNPFLGYRAIRLCLDRKDIFKTQLRALLRASVYGNLKIMFPMISCLEELLEAKSVLEEVKKDLDKENISYSKDVQVGMMIEVPSAAIISDILAKHVDFFSIGTNDLIQYTCAVDRMNEKIHNLYNPFNPAVLRLIKLVIDNGHKEGIWVGMCGEVAGDKRLIPILIGMGLDEFSMSPISILPARKLINSLSYEEMKKISDEVLKLTTADEIQEYIQKVFA
ncbi:phosphotransferase system, enzyme I, PtsI [Alkalithermobacter thermoalcaliphilus JW-YL-7 = DSM 7308]|uniref:Phosphoenolpyruvate-protein phosphotransferase n=1 Tax=Alkalithermobacter thermoalcaliphilus JW-YL-7 = DSM 7308 TaxID=1121328 RepID=A0A150FPH3_CLOPD|nr:phosphoenolpyruvate-protein phosphotransferase [[Clostridium] paradoxum JW-YL-7 = DSM 7308]SHL25808.1 phosphotransferase system, enzyme I, PtsI [[Clostridium] paradoxum JW-YL-7 = DSM 7308]